MVGWTDLPADLSDLAALTRLNAHLPDAPVISSDLSRAVTTADALSPRLRLPQCLRQFRVARHAVAVGIGVFAMGLLAVMRVRFSQLVAG